MRETYKKSFITTKMLASSFHGRIDEFPGICVDNFENASRVEARAYFLSHCHSDHTQGLHTPELLHTLERTNACIYMSELTAAIIDNEKKEDRLMEFVRPLKLGRTTLITLPSVPEKDLEELFIDVTLLSAGHSMGSVMFLFQTPLKTVLFTGDFHLSSSDVSKYNHLHKNGDPIKLDALYVDTTFIGGEYEDFPKRDECTNSAIHEMRKWLGKDTENRVALHTSAKYGYEFVFRQIYEQLNMKVYVNEERWRFYSTHTDLIPGVTNDKNSSRIHICRNKSQSWSHWNCLPVEYKDLPPSKFLYVHFSAMKWRNLDLEGNTYDKVSDNRIDVCFPTHCSRREIQYFVNYFCPAKVVGFPKEYRSNLQRNNSGDRNGIQPMKRRKITPKKESGKEMKMDKKLDSALVKKIFDM